MLAFYKYLLLAAFFCSNAISMNDDEKNENDIFIREEQCVSCLQEGPLLVGFPCLHQCLCAQCALQWQKKSRNCPLCLGYLENMVTIQRLKKEQQKADDEQEHADDLIYKCEKFIYRLIGKNKY